MSDHWQEIYDLALDVSGNRPANGAGRYKTPLKQAWARGYADAATGRPPARCDDQHSMGIGPYQQSVRNHGATWGYQMNRAYREGYEEADDHE